MRRVYTVILVIGIGTAAYLAGATLGRILSTQKANAYLGRRSVSTAAASEGHIRIEIGDTLPNVTLETLDGTLIQLYSVLSGPACLISIHPQCGTCMDELREIARLQKEIGTIGPFIFISACNPRELEDVRDSLGLSNLFLYDHRGQFLYRFGLDVFPLLVRVDEYQCIREVVLGALLPTEIEEAITQGQI